MAAKKSTSAPRYELSELPGSAALLARAATTALRRPKGVPELPRDAVRVRNVAADADKLKAYRKVCGLAASESLPLTYPHVCAGSLHMWLMEQPDFPLPLLGLVHLANRFEQAKPIAVDRTLDYTVRLESAQRTERGLEFDLVTSANAGRVHVWEGVSTYLYRMPQDAGISGAKPGNKAAPPAPPQLGRQQVLAVPADTGRRYAAVSGDYNPIHLHPLSAKLFGFPRAIAHGMWSAARCLALLESAYEMTPEKMQIRFRQPLLLPAQTELRSREQGEDIEFLLVGKADHLHLDGTLN